MDKKLKRSILEQISELDCCSIFAYENSSLTVYNRTDEYIKEYSYKNKIFNKKYVKYDNINDILDKNIFYFAIHEKYSITTPIYNKLKNIENIGIVFYKDTYIDDYWFLEIFSSAANKGAGLEYVKNYTKADLAVAFGDNSNDIDMLEKADIGVAVSNAVDALKEKADIIIGTNDEDSVSEYIYKDYFGL